MSIGNIIRSKQPDVYRELVKITNNKKDFEKMMCHDSYKRVGGAIRQVKNG